jgi:hypothetical protein
VKQSDLGEYEEKMQEKRKIYKIKHQLPHKPSHNDGKHQSPPVDQQNEKNQGVWWRYGQLSLNVYVSHLNDSLLYMISQEVVSPLKVSHSFVEDWVLTIEMALVLSQIRETLSNLTPKSLMVCTIYEIWEQQLAAVTYSASVMD